jgi:hypothetical protein
MIQKLEIPFIANKGQTNEQVEFYANTFGGCVFVTKDGEIVYSLPLQDFGAGEKNKEEAQIIKGVAFKESLVGGKIDKVKGEKISTVTVNYFKGKTPSMWNGNISTYELVNFGEVYKGIDLKLKAYGNNVEKLFYVKPNADVGVIRLRLSGAKILTVNEKGQLEVEIDSRIVKFTKPVAYQENMGERKEVAVNYSLFNSECSNLQPETIYGFVVDNYDRAKELVIDPLLASTYLGGAHDDSANSTAIDHVGNIYVTGKTSSSDFPTMLRAYDTSYNGNDAFVSKLSGDLSRLLASTYLGGSDNEVARSITMASDGSVYMSGETWSSDFPTTIGAYDNSFNGGFGDAFISRLNESLTHLLASTFLGGYHRDRARSIAIDSSGNIYVTGETRSSDFPTTPGAFDISYNGDADISDTFDVFISRFDSNLSASPPSNKR